MAATIESDLPGDTGSIQVSVIFLITFLKELLVLLMLTNANLLLKMIKIITSFS